MKVTLEELEQIADMILQILMRKNSDDCIDMRQLSMVKLGKPFSKANTNTENILS